MDGAWAGPYDETRLREMAQALQLVPSDLVAREGAGGGVRAQDADLGLTWPDSARSGTGATPARRIGAAAIDATLAFAVLTPFLVMSIAAAVEDVLANDSGGLLSTVAFLVTLLGGLALMSVQCYQLATRGQTIGKRLLRLRIVMKDTGQLAGFWRVVGVRLWLNSLFAMWLPYGIADIAYLFSSDQMTLHDRIARTKVISVSEE